MAYAGYTNLSDWFTDSMGFFQQKATLDQQIAALRLESAAFLRETPAALRMTPENKARREKYAADIAKLTKNAHAVERQVPGYVPTAQDKRDDMLAPINARRVQLEAERTTAWNNYIASGKKIELLWKVQDVDQLIQDNTVASRSVYIPMTVLPNLKPAELKAQDQALRDQLYKLEEEGFSFRSDWIDGKPSSTYVKALQTLRNAIGKQISDLQPRIREAERQAAEKPPRPVFPVPEPVAPLTPRQQYVKDLAAFNEWVRHNDLAYKNTIFTTDLNYQRSKKTKAAALASQLQKVERDEAIAAQQTGTTPPPPPPPPPQPEIVVPPPPVMPPPPEIAPPAEIAGEPEMPEAPEMGEGPVTPEPPEVPGVPEMPVAPETPDAPEMGELPVLPGAEIPEIDIEVPSIPSIPELPTVDIPTVPEIPEVPEVQGGELPPAPESAIKIGSPKTWLAQTKQMLRTGAVVTPQEEEKPMLTQGIFKPLPRYVKPQRYLIGD